MALQRNYYEVMGVRETATPQEIKTKYRELARKFHPDLVQDKDLGKKIFSQVNQAYHVLSDADRRAEYDQSLEMDRMQRVVPSPPSAPKPAASAPAAERIVDVSRQLTEAETAIMNGKAEEADAICRRILAVAPRNAKALELLGDSLTQQKQIPTAVEAYREAVAIMPTALLQSKLARAEQMRATVAASAAAQPKPRPSSQPEKSTGLFGRILGRK